MGTNRLVLRAFGKFQVELNGFSVFEKFCRSEKAKELFRYLLLFKDTKINKEKLLDIFWPGMTLDKAYQNLNSTVYLIRNAFDRASEKGIGKSIVRSSNQMFWLVLPEGYYYDVEEFKNFVNSAIHEHDDQRRIEYCKKAIEIYKGDLFTEDIYSEWSVSFREEYRELMINTLVLLVETLYKEKRFDECMYYIIKILEMDKYNESAIYYKILVLVSKKLYNQALKVYEEFAALLKEEMDISPSINLKELYYEVKKQIRNENTPTITPDIPNFLEIEEFKKYLKFELKKRCKNFILIEIFSKNSLIIKEKILNELFSNLREADIISAAGDKIYALLVDLKSKNEGGKIIKRLQKRFRGSGISVEIKDVDAVNVVETLS